MLCTVNPPSHFLLWLRIIYCLGKCSKEQCHMFMTQICCQEALCLMAWLTRMGAQILAAFIYKGRESSISRIEGIILKWSITADGPRWLYEWETGNGLPSSLHIKQQSWEVNPHAIGSCFLNRRYTISAAGKQRLKIKIKIEGYTNDFLIWLQASVHLWWTWQRPSK